MYDTFVILSSTSSSIYSLILSQQKDQIYVYISTFSLEINLNLTGGTVAPTVHIAVKTSNVSDDTNVWKRSERKRKR